MIVNNSVLWNVTPYSLVDLYQRFGGVFCLNCRVLGSVSTPTTQYHVTENNFIQQVGFSYLNFKQHFLEVLFYWRKKCIQVRKRKYKFGPTLWRLLRQQRFLRATTVLCTGMRTGIEILLQPASKNAFRQSKVFSVDIDRPTVFTQLAKKYS